MNWLNTKKVFLVKYATFLRYIFKERGIEKKEYFIISADKKDNFKIILHKC